MPKEKDENGKAIKKEIQTRKWNFKYEKDKELKLKKKKKEM